MNSIQLDQPATTTVQRHHVHGWTVSMLLHLCGIGSVFMVMAELERPALPQPFRFDVALVQPVAPNAVGEAEPARTPPPAVTQRSMERNVEAKRVIATAREIPRVTRDTMMAPAQVVSQPAEEKPAPRVQSVHETGQPITQSAQESRTFATQQVVPSEAIAQNSIVETVTSMPVAQEVVERVEQVETERMAWKEKTVEQAAAIQQTAVVTHQHPQHTRIASQVEHRVVTQRTVQALPQAQADYGWLAESLWQRIEQLKRYPPQARARHWEGKVILEAVIRDDGTIMELRIEESSGHAILDQDALTVVKKASPLTLKHSLGEPHITILVPITYNLDS